METVTIERYIDSLESIDPMRVYGRVVEITGVILKATGMKASIGEACKVYSEGGSIVDAEVVGFKDDKALLMAVGDIQGIKSGSRVLPVGRKLSVNVSPHLVGRVIDALGNPIDGKGRINGQAYPLFGNHINPLERQRISEPMDLGIRAINGLLTCGKGQRVGIMAGTGVGKSVLLGMIARYTEATVNVIGLIGERSREVREFIERDLGEEGLRKSVVIVCTAQEPPLAKVRAAFTTTAIAEYFRDQGMDVLLMMDSLTRVSMAQREVGLAIGEPPTTKGYTPSVFTLMPRLLERAGTSSDKGSITGLYTVLVEGDDLTDPVADASMSVLDGHIVLSRDLAMEGVYPAIDILRSVSRVMLDIVDDRHRELAMMFIENLSTYKKYEDLISIGAYKEGTNPKVDRAMKMIDRLRSYLKQGINDRRDMGDSLQGLYLLFEAEEL
ncbi:Flagellum-specific ATP synthase FliI [hydrothermal vent metagenome]|uniref:Flagellum-specific ATP synthase FliI n=1 Tax=hydrothermal vent metagenome TaxID=652676 RepID=A0A3B1D7Y5_9ZZZZ